MAYDGYSQGGYSHHQSYDYNQQQRPAYSQHPQHPQHPHHEVVVPRQSQNFAPPASNSSNPNYRWWIPADGIRRDVITADIQRYLGPDALVKPGEGRDENRGRPGYWIAAYRTLTPSMVADLRSDSARFEREGARGRYEDSHVHESRQYHGSTDHQRGVAPPHFESAPPRQTFNPRPSQPGYGLPPEHQSTPVGYGHPVSSSASPAQDPNYTTTAYGSRPHPSPSYPPRNPDPRAQVYATETQATPRGYAGQPGTGPTPAQRGRTPPGYYLASNGQYYPLSQQPGH